MGFRLVLFLSFFAAVLSGKLEDLQLEPDEPLLRVQVSQEATVRCCYRCKESPEVSWIKNTPAINGTTMPDLVTFTKNVMNKPEGEKDGVICHSLVFKSVSVNDMGLYQCKLKHGLLTFFSHGTFLQIYLPLEKTLNLSEGVKNSIITVEGVLLLMCVLIPGTMLLCKSKKVNKLDRKTEREEENIYEGLNLDDCNSAYHQIQRSIQQGPYEDVACCEEDIQLEKP